MRARPIVEALGGRGVLRLGGSNLDELNRTVKAGLPYESLENVRRRFALTREEVASTLHLPPRTVARRKKARRLRPDESDRLLRLARLGAQAAEVLGSDKMAAKWLRRPNTALGGEVPLDLLATDIGAHLVEDVLVRIRHGVYS